jgi:transglutaminase-like putative cysteine protease
MQYDLRHRVTYTYQTAVPESRQLIRMTPVSRDGQRVVASSLTIGPEPAERGDGIDFYGNAWVRAVIAEPHDELAVETRGRVVVERGDVPDLGATLPRSDLPELTLKAGNLAPASPVHFIFPTRLVPILPEIAAYAGEAFGPDVAVARGAFDLAARIREEFSYDPEATDVATPVGESFRARAGVCQDFAQIMLAGLRGLGVPCRYVSGYLRTNPPPGEPRLEGADATHAWVDVWCGPETGWIGFDPTNAVLALDDHIVLAIGRDYSDVAPILGVIRLYGGHGLEVAVDVIPVEA